MLVGVIMLLLHSSFGNNCYRITKLGFETSKELLRLNVYKVILSTSQHEIDKLHFTLMIYLVEKEQIVVHKRPSKVISNLFVPSNGFPHTLIIGWHLAWAINAKHSIVIILYNFGFIFSSTLLLLTPVSSSYCLLEIGKASVLSLYFETISL